jgi:hypothetical protein
VVGHRRSAQFWPPSQELDLTQRKAATRKPTRWAPVYPFHSVVELARTDQAYFSFFM